MIRGCTLQNMDIIRLLAQELESLKPPKLRNPFTNYGSCDSYVAIGNGKFTEKTMITGYHAYSKAVCSLLKKIIPGLELQGAKEVVFEGVQLMPLTIKPYLKNKNKVIVITSSEQDLKTRVNQMFFGNQKLLERYSVDKLLIIQNEILRQLNFINPNKYYVVDNSSDLFDSTDDILTYLLNSKTIKEI